MFINFISKKLLTRIARPASREIISRHGSTAPACRARACVRRRGSAAPGPSERAREGVPPERVQKGSRVARPKGALGEAVGLLATIFGKPNGLCLIISPLTTLFLIFPGNFIGTNLLSDAIAVVVVMPLFLDKRSNLEGRGYI